MLAIWSLVPLPFLIPACTSGISRFMYCLSLAWRILSITLLPCEMSTILITLFWQFPSLGLGFPNSSVGKESACNAGDPSSIPGSGRSPGEGKGYPLQYSGLENSVDCIDHGVAKSQTRLSDFHFHFSGIGMKVDLFQLCGHCWIFQICWYIECSTLRASSFRVWNSSCRIPSPPLALFIIILPKAHFTFQDVWL